MTPWWDEPMVPPQPNYEVTMYYATQYNPHRWMFWRRWAWLNAIRDADGKAAWSDTLSCDEIMFGRGKS